MKIKSFILLILIPALAHYALAQQIIFSVQKSKVGFTSEAPLELISASSEKLQGVIDNDKHTFAFSIPIKSFKGFNSPLQQEHFYENYMEERTYPTAKFDGKIIEIVNFQIDGNYSIRAKGKLVIHGVEQERIIRVNVKANKGKLNVDSEFSVMLQDHNITIPKVVYQKIAEEIKVKVVADFIKK